MWLRICGVRGSRPAAGSSFSRVGGNTSCVAFGRRGELPSLVLDAGTGLTTLMEVMGDHPFRGTILFGHLHWDHTGGLPFFPAADRADSSVHVLVPAQGVDVVGLLERMMSPPHFPIKPTELRGSWSFDDIDEGRHSIEGFEVLAREIPHKGGRTFGYRVTDPSGGCVAYLSDHAPQRYGGGITGFGELHEAAIELARDADVLIHDAQYSPDEFAKYSGFGHSVADYGALLAERAGAARVLLFHHDPNRTDDDVDALAHAVAARHPDVTVEIAVERMVIDL